MIIFIVALTFGCIALAVMSLYWLLVRPASAVTARLESMDPSLAFVENNPMTTMAERVAEPLNRMVPLSAVEAAKLQKQLLQAGYPSHDAAMAFRAIQLTLMVAIPTLVVTLCFLYDRSPSTFVVWGGVGAAVGFYLPRYVLRKKILNRQQRIRWALADALDLMVIAVEAGLGLNAALNRIGEELRNTHA